MVKTALATAEPDDNDFTTWAAELSAPETTTIDVVELEQLLGWAETVVTLAQRSALVLTELISQFNHARQFARETGEHQLERMEQLLLDAQTQLGLKAA